MGTFDRLLKKTSAINQVVKLPIDNITKSPYQPRQEFDEMELRDLAKSIDEVGLIQPVVVRKSGAGYELIAGERRLRASKMAGLKEISAVVVEMDNEKAAIVGLIENIQRKELNYFEEAQAYAKLIGEFGLTQEEVADKVSKSQSAIANKLRLLKLSDAVRNRIAPDVITERHARALLKLETDEEQIAILDEIYEKDLTVKQTETEVERIRQNISREITNVNKREKVSLNIKDPRVFVNTIKEAVYRAKQEGIEMYIMEREFENEIEVVVKIPKIKGLESQ